MGQAISSLLERSGKKKEKTDPSRLAEYLRWAESNPQLASPDLLAQGKFLEGEEARAAYDVQRLGLPLKKSIPARQKMLDEVIALYRASVDHGVPEWAHASAYRIGQALVAFGEALEASERPADLSGDNLLAYEEVLFKESQVFYDRGEDVWADLLKQNKGKQTEVLTEPNSWITQARASLWKRLADRFFFRAEFEFPLAAATAPAAKELPEDGSGTASIPADGARPVTPVDRDGPGGGY